MRPVYILGFIGLAAWLANAGIFVYELRLWKRREKSLRTYMIAGEVDKAQVADFVHAVLTSHVKLHGILWRTIWQCLLVGFMTFVMAVK